jgi:preprotein translocase subunit Sss1
LKPSLEDLLSVVLVVAVPFLVLGIVYFVERI